MAVAGTAGGAAWFMRIRPGTPAQTSQAAASVPILAADVEPKEPTPAAVTEEQVQTALAEAPLLAPEAARALLTESARRGQAPSHALDGALFVASVGFPDLDRSTLDELGGLFTKGWSTLSAAEQNRIQAYMQYARAGEPLSTGALASGRALFVRSVNALPAKSQARLTVLFAQAVTAGIAHQQQAEERARVAALTPLPAVESPALATATGRTAVAAGTTTGAGRVPYTSSSSGRSSTGGSESYWRSRAARARSAIATAEKRVKDLEDQAARGGLVVPGPTQAACQAGAVANPLGLGSVALRDSSRGAVTCDAEILRQQRALATQNQLEAARQSLKRAQEAKDALEEEARRAGALPGWLR